MNVFILRVAGAHEPGNLVTEKFDKKAPSCIKWMSAGMSAYRVQNRKQQ